MWRVCAPISWRDRCSSWVLRELSRDGAGGRMTEEWGHRESYLAGFIQGMIRSLKDDISLWEGMLKALYDADEA